MNSQHELGPQRVPQGIRTRKPGSQLEPHTQQEEGGLTWRNRRCWQPRYLCPACPERCLCCHSGRHGGWKGGVICLARTRNKWAEGPIPERMAEPCPLEQPGHWRGPLKGPGGYTQRVWVRGTLASPRHRPSFRQYLAELFGQVQGTPGLCRTSPWLSPQSLCTGELPPALPVWWWGVSPGRDSVEPGTQEGLLRGWLPLELSPTPRNQVASRSPQGGGGLVAPVVSDSCDPRDCSPPGSSVHGILQARILEWVAIFFSGGSSWPRDQTRISLIISGFFTAEPLGKPKKPLWTNNSSKGTFLTLWSLSSDVPYVIHPTDMTRLLRSAPWLMVSATSLPVPCLHSRCHRPSLKLSRTLWGLPRTDPTPSYVPPPDSFL